MRYYQTGALTIVITPLQALMKDQVDTLLQRGITAAATMNGSLSLPERKQVLDGILLDEAYYNFILAGIHVTDGIAWVREGRLIPLKANAWLDMSEKVAKGEVIDSKKIRKHLHDVIRLSQLLTTETRIDLPARVAEDLKHFLGLMLHEKVDMKSLVLGRIDLPTVVERIRGAYGLA